MKITTQCSSVDGDLSHRGFTGAVKQTVQLFNIEHYIHLCIFLLKSTLA